MTSQLAAGIDIGGTNTLIGLVSSGGKVVARKTINTCAYRKPEEFVEVLSKTLKSLLKKNQKLRGVGIGAPSGHVYSGSIVKAPNMPWKGTIPLAAMISRKLKTRTVLTNDANAAALGEMLLGGAKKERDFIYITLGTGLGSGLVANGKLLYGGSGFAGEIGHVIIDRLGRACGCGRRGCLETYCSATGLVNTYKEMKNLRPDDQVSADQIFKLARKGDPSARQTFQITGSLLGEALANAVVFTSPSVIFVGGGLARAGNLLFQPMKKAFGQNLLHIYKGKVKILPSKLPDGDAALLGAASLILRKQA